MTMYQCLLSLAALSLLVAACFLAFFLGAGGRMGPGLPYLLCSVAGGVFACLFAGLAFLRKARLESSPAAQAFWGIAGGAALLPVGYVLVIFFRMR